MRIINVTSLYGASDLMYNPNGYFGYIRRKNGTDILHVGGTTGSDPIGRNYSYISLRQLLATFRL